jgi:predicted nucleic acid-binding protein
VLGTNVLIYAYDPADPGKQIVAQKLVADQIAAGTLVVSAQVLNEFYYRATKQNRKPAMSHEDAAEVINGIAATAVVLPLTGGTTLRALDAVERYKMAFWDALIWAVAFENEVTVIHTEDIPSAGEIDGVRYINPFT